MVMDKVDKHYQSQPLETDNDLDMDPSELTYSLEIVQQPIRARMCGFGDKDRRNVTPAPVLKLVAKKKKTGEIVPASQLNERDFVVTADLWLEDQKSDRNLVLISSIPSSKTAAYSQQHALTAQESQKVVDRLEIQSYSSSLPIGNAGDDSATSSAATTPGPSSALAIPRMSIQNVIHGDGNASSSTGQVARSPSNSSPSQQTLSDADGQNLEEQEEDELDTSIDTGDDEERRDNDPFVEQDLKKLECMAMESGRHGLSTRNLVGQIAVSGQTAPDLNNEAHIWFAFSILSVRTEGFFKIRFCLTDIKRIPVGGKSETVCEIFSNTIHVQTPKKFEGTCDNNKIAVHLNKNNIRIPARKDEKKLSKNKRGSMTSPTQSLD
ncbi:hypothetical protein BGX34_009553 [Mortierella sp. NVP85]|nr:hypothetical protein BGX34_009553 [Mortierella sp. NVP85]